MLSAAGHNCPVAVTIFTSPRFSEHVTPPGHPERPERAGVFDAVADAFRASGGVVTEPRPATRAELERIHTADYLDLIASTAGQSGIGSLRPHAKTSAQNTTRPTARKAVARRLTFSGFP